MGVLDKIQALASDGRRIVVPLIDPDRFNPAILDSLVGRKRIPPAIFVGGSIVSADTNAVVRRIKSYVGDSSEVVLFPGDCSQLSSSADALLLLSLVSGRNPEYLIGQHVKSAPKIRRLGLEAIPTAYMLIDGGRATSVQYVSGTMPLPADKVDLSVATAMAAELLGFKMLYLEAGSGARIPVSSDIISAVRSSVSIPIIVGGGVRSAEAVGRAFAAGADIVVIGTALEQNPALANEFW